MMSSPFSPFRGAIARAFAEGFVVSIIAVCVVAGFSAITSEMMPRWDSVSYNDVAEHGLIGNPRLLAPFAYRPAAPLLIGAISRLAGWSVREGFHFCLRLTSVVLIVGCFFLARRLGAGAGRALWITLVLLLNFIYIHKPLMSVSMVDAYAYPIFVLAFYLLWEGYLWQCVAVAGAGLFFKEFLLIPLLTVASIWIWKWRRVAVIGAILLVCFILPRVLIHVTASFQDIDPAHPETLVRLIKYPLNWRRWFNILFSYVAIWLPVWMLLTRPRVRTLRRRLQPRAALLATFLALHLALVMYGGTNILIFVSYSLPVEILVLNYLLEDGRPHVLELVCVSLAVVVFNRTWARIPLPEEGVDRFLDYYGGFFHLVTTRSLLRLAEALAYIGSAQLLRWLLPATTTQTRSAEPLSLENLAK